MEGGPGVVTSPSTALGDLPGRSDRLMLYALDLEWDLPAWFDRLDAIPSKSPLDAWRWSWREYGSGLFGAKNIGKDLAWTISSYARATNGKDGHGRRWVTGEAGAQLETMARHMGVGRRALTDAMRQGDRAGWWVYLPGNRNRPTWVFLSLPKKEPDRPVPAKRPDLSGKQPCLTNGAESPLINGAEVLDQAQKMLDHRHKPEENPKPEYKSELVEKSSTVASPARENDQETDSDDQSDMVLIRWLDGDNPPRLVPPTMAEHLIKRGNAEIVSPSAGLDAGAA